MCMCNTKVWQFCDVNPQDSVSISASRLRSGQVKHHDCNLSVMLSGTLTKSPSCKIDSACITGNILATKGELNVCHS